MMKLISLLLAGGAGYWLAQSGLIVPNNLSQTEQNLVNAYRANLANVTSAAGTVANVAGGVQTAAQVVGGASTSNQQVSASPSVPVTG